MRADWTETEATVASVVKLQNSRTITYEAVITYTVDGSYFATTVCGWKFYAQGQKLKIFYDPGNPDRNNLSQRERLKKLVYVIFFAALGILAVYLFLHPDKK
jgi:hypothetical protein